jgi:hypothetical protein
MIERKTVPVDDENSIGIVTEQMADSTWAVVASVTHQSPNGEKITDLPVSDTRYPTQAAAEDAGLNQGREWLARNVSRAA